MSDVIAIFNLLFITGLAFPGLLTTWSLLFPNLIERARKRVERTPWTTFWMGVAGTILFAIPIAILLAMPFAPAKFFGWVGIFLALTFASFGAAGIAAQMGTRISARLTRRAKPDMSEFAAFVWGAVAFELAAVFPVLGWFIIIPFGIITSMGASVFALFNWMPKTQLRQAMQTIPQPTTDIPIEPQSL
ncbi:MAG: hypothetical protein Fur0022_43870 [Anaerolineales bacterium]